MAMMLNNRVLGSVDNTGSRRLELSEVSVNNDCSFQRRQMTRTANDHTLERFIY